MSDEELFEYLMTSDLVENWNIGELRKMIIFFRNKVRSIHNSKKVLDYKIDELEKAIEYQKRLALKKEIERKEWENKYIKLKSRKLSFKERLFGKIK